MQILSGEGEKASAVGLKIVAQGEKSLSKTQISFNKLVKQIETLEKKILIEKEKLSRLSIVYGKEVVPFRNQIANERLQLAMAIGRATELNKYTPKQTEKVQRTILILCDQAFEEIEPTPEQEAFYDKWSDVSYRKELEQQKIEEKEMFAGFMKHTYGMDINMDNFEEDPESYARFQEELKEKFEQSQQSSHQTNHKKTKKQQAQESTQKSKDELKTRGLRSIYITLVKLLHPDVETDETLKAEKDEIMKKVTVAYDQKDLLTLLKLEMEWVHKTYEHLEKLSEDKLKMYIMVLKEQVADLESEKSGLYHHPLYKNVSQYSHMPENYAVSSIMKEGSLLKRTSKELKNTVRIFQRREAKKDVLEFVNQFCDANDFLDDIENDFFPY